MTLPNQEDLSQVADPNTPAPTPTDIPVPEGGVDTPAANDATPGEPAPAQSDISLPREEYNQMLAAIATMQAQLSARQTARQQTPPEPEVPAPTSEELNQMSQTDLVGYIQQQQQPLMQTVMNMAVQLELQDVKSKYSDFGEYSDQILQVASGNPSLSLEQAYLITKQSVAANTKPAASPPATSEPKKTPPASPPPATKQTPAPSVAQESHRLDPRAAAIAAAKELGIE